VCVCVCVCVCACIILAPGLADVMTTLFQVPAMVFGRGALAYPLPCHPFLFLVLSIIPRLSNLHKLNVIIVMELEKQGIIDKSNE
jgi:hypothetical protein